MFSQPAKMAVSQGETDKANQEPGGVKSPASLKLNFLYLENEVIMPTSKNEVRWHLETLSKCV